VDDSGEDNQTEDGPNVASEVDKLIVTSIGDESPRPHVVVHICFLSSFRSLTYQADINEVQLCCSV
jgi:hypothetical protein